MELWNQSPQRLVLFLEAQAVAPVRLGMAQPAVALRRAPGRAPAMAKAADNIAPAGFDKMIARIFGLPFHDFP